MFSTVLHEGDIVGLGRAPTKPTIVQSEGVRGSGPTIDFSLDIWQQGSHYWQEWYVHGRRERKGYWRDRASSKENE